MKFSIPFATPNSPIPVMSILIHWYFSFPGRVYPGNYDSAQAECQGKTLEEAGRKRQYEEHDHNHSLSF
jgi:hypothetical protein